MVYNYDIYYRRGPRSTQVYRVTNDAVPGIIYNGVPDWLYEGKFNFIIGFFIKKKKTNDRTFAMTIILPLIAFEYERIDIKAHDTDV